MWTALAHRATALARQGASLDHNHMSQLVTALARAIHHARRWQAPEGSTSSGSSDVGSDSGDIGGAATASYQDQDRDQDRDMDQDQDRDLFLRAADACMDALAGRMLEVVHELSIKVGGWQG